MIEHNTMLAFQLPRINSQRITVTSQDPGLLLLSSSPTSAGAASIEDRPGNTIYIHGLAAEGRARIRLSSEGFDSADLEFTLLPLSVTTQSAQKLFILAPNTTLDVDLSVSPIRPGAEVVFEVVSSSSGVARPASAKLELRASSRTASIRLVTGGEGEAVIRIRDDAGETITSFTVRVERPSLTFTSPAVGKDMQANGLITTASGVALSDNTIVTLTSLAPEKLLLSRSNGNAATSISVPLFAPFPTEPQFILHGLSDQGEAPVRISAEGFADSIVNVRLAPVAAVLNFDPGIVFSPGKTINGTVSVIVLDNNQSSSERSSQLRRSGAPPLNIDIVSTDPAVVAVATPRVTIAPGASFTAVNLRLLNTAGLAVVEALIPEGFTDPGSRRLLPINLANRPLQLTCNRFDGITPYLITVARQTITSCVFNSQEMLGRTLQVRSLNPALALVSFGNAEPSASTSQEFTQSSGTVLNISGLAGAGRATVELSGAGFETFLMDVDLAESYVGLASSAPLNLIVGRSVSQLVGLRLASTGELVSPREFLAIGVTASSPLIRVNPSSGNVSNFTNNFQIQVEGVNPGTANVQFTAPSGFTTRPASVVVTRP